MDRRRSPRVGAHLPVRVWGVDAHDLPFMQLASVKNLSGTGAVIHGMRRQMRPGEILEVQMDKEKAQFRVVWTGMPGTNAAGPVSNTATSIMRRPARPTSGRGCGGSCGRGSR